MKTILWIGRMVLELFVLGMLLPSVAAHADEKAAPRGSVKVDYPLGVVAFASLDRVRARADSLGAAVGVPAKGDKLLLTLLDAGGDDEASQAVSKFLNSPGLDSTKPFGAMSYPSWFQQPAEEPDPNSKPPEPFKLPELSFESLIEGLAELFVQNTTLVLCIPTRDRQILLTSIQEFLDNEDDLKEVAEEPGWYWIQDQKTRLGFVGSYLFIVASDASATRFNRNYPDFEKLAKASLGKSGFVYSLNRRGLPEIVREGIIPSYKMALAAHLQRRDDEPEKDFRLRTMFGTFQTELLDVALSHVEEFRITGHVDSATRTIFVEPELLASKDGKLAKFCNGLLPRSTPFAHIPHDSGPISVLAALPLPQKLWKPVSDSLYEKAQSIAQPEAAEMLRILARTVDSGQLDFYAMNPNWSEGLIAVRVPGGSKFPDQFQLILQKLTDHPLFELALDSVEGFPIHRTLTRVENWNPLGFLAEVISGRFAHMDAQLPSLNQPRDELEAEATITTVQQADDGTQKSVTQKQTIKIPAATESIWIAATPQAIWLGVSSTTSETCPDWFKTQLVGSLVKPAGTSTRNRSNAPFQLTLRGLGTSPEGIEEKNQGVGESKDKPRARTENTTNTSSVQKAFELERTKILRDMPNAIHCELRSTDTGLKLSIAFQEAYFQWCATYAKEMVSEEAE